MIKKISLISVLIIMVATPLVAQSTIKYPHCNCVEKLNYSADNKEIPEGKYELICNNSQIIAGQYVNGLKSGKWISRTSKGVVIKNAEYRDGKLNGEYHLFHFDGTSKLVANFTDGKPDGAWDYFNERGKVIKTGRYQSGSPTGIWTIFDKSGKRAMVTYNFDNKNSPNLDAPPYFKKGGIQRDDQSGEWFIIYYPERNLESDIQPLGGYALACDFFIKYLTIPVTMMDTYTNFNFKITLHIENNVLKDVSSKYVYRAAYNSKVAMFPFIVSTNPPAKLKTVEHSEHEIELLREQVEETMLLMGPWIGNAAADIYVPFVLNEVKK